MKPFDVNTLCDTLLRTQAIRVAEGAMNAGALHDIRRATLKRLQQVATNEPLRICDYAVHQLNRSTNVAAAPFWQVVCDCCRTPAGRTDWSLERAAHDYFDPAWLNLDEQIPPGSPVEMRQERNRLKDERRRFLARWISLLAPRFFDLFCIECQFRLFT